MPDKGKKAIPALVKSLREDKHAPNRAAAVYALSFIDRLNAEVVPDYGHALADTDPEVRSAATYGLSRLGPAAHKAIPLVFAMLKSEKLETNREKACGTLLNINLKGQKSYVPTVMELLSDRNENVVILAAYLLGQLGKDAQQARPALQKIAETRQGPLADAAREALRQIEP
jgi:HEAT repeat protein